MSAEPIPSTQFIRTLPDRCRVCYSCVRSCPAKAIRIVDGQADVIAQRCVGCGHCVRMCSQKAKQVVGAGDKARQLLSLDTPVAALVAPSYPAEFTDISTSHFVGMLRALGFSRVVEVAFGADLVARRYRSLYNHGPAGPMIEASCPAVVSFIEKFHPTLVGALAPVISPMVATGRLVKRRYGADTSCIFIGPCIAKKGESERFPEDVDCAITFVELRGLLSEAGIVAADVIPSEFDPPHARGGGVYPLSHGIFHAAGIGEDLFSHNTVSATGRSEFLEAIHELEQGDFSARFVEMLACSGCVMGAGMSTACQLHAREAQVARVAKERKEMFDLDRWKTELDAALDLRLERDFLSEDRRLASPGADQLAEILCQMGKIFPEDELNCGACGYESCVEHAVAIYKGLAEDKMCLPFTIERLENTVQALERSQEELAHAQAALMHSERLASMGQLAAGIAHEVNNPLGVVLLYAHILMERCEKNPEIIQEIGMIAEQADRCKKIVSGLLQFARRNKVIHQPVDIPSMLHHLVKTMDTDPGITWEIRVEMTDPVAQIDADQILQVLTNLITNAQDAMTEGGRITVSASDTPSHLRLAVGDTGCGIARENISRIYSPFFTTKKIGKGTGLGLAVSYGIIKMHSGDIQVETNADPACGPTGTTFIISLPRLGGE
ncbi:4Fe-4S dicluster domain-containing protein [Myxococcota bacterium]|nr:4Fe-4S dicluster domain-containing protein [Myxococcota bacterium]